MVKITFFPPPLVLTVKLSKGTSISSSTSVTATLDPATDASVAATDVPPFASAAAAGIFSTPEDNDSASSSASVTATLSPATAESESAMDASSPSSASSARASMEFTSNDSTNIANSCSVIPTSPLPSSPPNQPFSSSSSIPKMTSLKSP